MSRIKCDICPHNCTLTSKGIGYCGNRLENLGWFSAGHLDPIEKKPLYHVNPGSFTLSMGSVGCNLSCPWCQNWSISKEHNKSSDTELKALKTIDLYNLAVSQKVDSITFTYNEPSISYEYIIEAARMFKKGDIKTYLVSNGYISNKYLESFYENITAVNIDLKSFNSKTYKDIIDGDLDTVLNTLMFLNKSKIWTEITTLIIPGINDSDKELRELITWIIKELGDKTPLHFSSYHPCYKYTKVERTPDFKILEAVKLAKDLGLKYVYPGNIQKNIYNDTFCLECNSILISRNGYKIKNYLIKDSCPNCKNILDGIFT